METQENCPILIDLTCCRTSRIIAQKTMGLAFITVDYKGIPITKYSGFTSHCMLGRRGKGICRDV